MPTGGPHAAIPPRGMTVITRPLTYYLTSEPLPMFRCPGCRVFPGHLEYVRSVPSPSSTKSPKGSVATCALGHCCCSRATAASAAWPGWCRLGRARRLGCAAPARPSCRMSRARPAGIVAQRTARSNDGPLTLSLSLSLTLTLSQANLNPSPNPNPSPSPHPNPNPNLYPKPNPRSSMGRCSPWSN